jgi:hypothetical protein
MSEVTIRYQFLVSETDLPQIALSENSQQIAHQQDHQHCAKAYPGTSAPAPPAVSVVSSAPSENERENNDKYNEHCESSFIPGRKRLATCDVIALFDLTPTSLSKSMQSQRTPRHPPRDVTFRGAWLMA